MSRCDDCKKDQRVNTPGEPIILTYHVPALGDDPKPGESRLELCPECYKKRFPGKCKPVKVIQEKCCYCHGSGKLPRYEGRCYKCGESHDPDDKHCPYFEMSPGDDY